MTHDPAQDANEFPPPGVAAVERSFENTQNLLGEFRDELAHLVAKVYRDVARLREAALGETAPGPWPDPVRSEEAEAERRLAEIVGEEQAMLRTRQMVNELIDERFRVLTNLIQAKLTHHSSSLQKLRSGPSRRKL